MKKGQIFEGIIEKVEFPNKGKVYVPEEDRYVIVKNGIPGQKVKFIVNKFKSGNAEGRLLEVLEKSEKERLRCSFYGNFSYCFGAVHVFFRDCSLIAYGAA